MRKNMLINWNFLCLWVGSFISQIGDKFYAIAIAWWILQKTDSPKAMGMYLVLSVLPQLVSGFFAGALVDKCNRKLIMIATDLIRGLLVCMTAVLSYQNQLQIWHLYAIGAAISLATALFSPAAQAILPQVVEKGRLKEANSMNQMIGGVCVVIGPVLGAATVGWLGLAYVFLFNGISYFASALFASLMVVQVVHRKSKQQKSIWKDVMEGVSFIRTRIDIMGVIIIIAIAHFFLGSLMVGLPFLAKRMGGNVVQTLGMFEAMLGIGFLLGSVYTRINKNEHMNEFMLIKLMMFVGACLVGIGLGQFLSIKTVIPYALLIMLCGVGIANASVYWQSLLQLGTPEHITGRVFSVSSLAGNVSLPVAYGVFGVLLSYVSIAVVMMICGSCLILIRFMPGIHRRQIQNTAAETVQEKLE